MMAKASTFRDDMRALIAVVNVIDEANASNDRIGHNLLKMYEQIYNEVKSVSTVELPEKLKPIFIECEQQLQRSTHERSTELANHKLERVKAAEGCQMDFDAGVSRRIVDDLHTVMHRSQHVEDTFAEHLLDTHSTTHAKSLQELEATKIDMQTKRSLLAENNRIEQLKQNFEERSAAASVQNIQGIDLINSICSSAEHFKENSAECMRQCGKDLRKFREKGFRAYEPSGGTPIKRDYRTNVRLPATEPHDLIKEEIRKKIDEGMALDCSIVNK